MFIYSKNWLVFGIFDCAWSDEQIFGNSLFKREKWLCHYKRCILFSLFGWWKYRSCLGNVLRQTFSVYNLHPDSSYFYLPFYQKCYPFIFFNENFRLSNFKYISDFVIVRCHRKSDRPCYSWVCNWFYLFWTDSFPYI